MAEMKQKSIKQNLVFKLLALILLTLAITYLASFLNSKKEIGEVFDADMIKSAKLIFRLVEHESFVKNNLDLDYELKQTILNRYEYKIHAQAWKKNKIIYNSGESLELEEPNYEGFKSIEINKKKWRSFSFFDKDSQIKILILEKKNIRNALVSEIMISLLIPLLISFIPIFFVIVSVVRNELKSLTTLAQNIEEISGKTLKQFRSPDVPSELQPFLNSFNSLLARLAESMESERRFTDHAAHELNTPLAAIKIQAQILATNKNPEKHNEYLQDLMAGINRATHLVEQLLTLSRLEVDDKSFTKEIVDLQNMIQSLIKNYQREADKKNLKISLLCSEKSLINANRFYIEILVRNLIDNAIKYSKDDKTIHVEILQKSDEKLSLKITNIGDQIAPEELTKIFNNFYRANNSQTQQTIAGCGLGLAIAKKIVDLHDGKIFFTSRNGLNLVEVIISAAPSN